MSTNVCVSWDSNEMKEQDYVIKWFSQSSTCICVDFVTTKKSLEVTFHVSNIVILPWKVAVIAMPIM